MKQVLLLSSKFLTPAEPLLYGTYSRQADFMGNPLGEKKWGKEEP